MGVRRRKDFPRSLSEVLFGPVLTPRSGTRRRTVTPPPSERSEDTHLDFSPRGREVPSLGTSGAVLGLVPRLVGDRDPSERGGPPSDRLGTSGSVDLRLQQSGSTVPRLQWPGPTVPRLKQSGFATSRLQWSGPVTPSLQWSGSFNVPPPPVIQTRHPLAPVVRARRRLTSSALGPSPPTFSGRDRHPLPPVVRVRHPLSPVVGSTHD